VVRAARPARMRLRQQVAVAVAVVEW